MSVRTDEEYVLVGTFPYISEGECIEATGRDGGASPFTVNSLQVEIAMRLKAPEETLASMERYLGSGAISGVGAALAARIVKKFKADTFRIMEEEPERLAEVKGISERMADGDFGSQVEAKKDMRQAMMFLAGVRHLHEPGREDLSAITVRECTRVIQENPYQPGGRYPGRGI